ncbi:hypothetical protein ABB29_00715 [Pseudoxanthomonas dokdonensis]|uniref:Carbohydrate-binding family V/XII n=1 Tax=Pseudoxanthomonas dokdonensis TaxID=344882 RepID=A0A0R0CQB9_9GAMM|nr:hypothetical protein ABB29_00715 [Pseudoxanthomonas dokdonensis]
MSACATDPAPATASVANASSATPATATAATADNADVHIDARPFPRQFQQGGSDFSIHQPQYDQWQDDQLKGRFVLSVATGSHADAQGKQQDAFDYGVVQFSARTQIDKEARAVVLSDLQLGPVSFPTAKDKEASYLQLVKSTLQPGKTLTVSLDQLESSLALSAIDSRQTSLPVSNQPPEIIFRQAPAVLVQIDGTPTLRAAGGGVERIINSRSLLLKQDNRYYLYLAGHWASAAALQGPWSAAGNVDAALQKAMQQAVAAQQVDTLEQAPDDLKQAFASGQLPDISVRSHPAELITTQGEPSFSEIAGTRLSYVDNTGADVFVDAAQDYSWYALVSGRWFSAASSQGPWQHVAASALPADFSKIPADSEKSGVLASIPGTPESREALIANSIPQTASVDRNGPKLDVPYDGKPEFKPIAGTALQYAWNTPVPVIRVDGQHFYAVDKGVWFAAAAATGPWSVADSVPQVIYTIPTSSPLHYVTYVRVYGSTDDVVYVGYTPGYYGTVVNNDVVVYGTGYGCDPWLGAYWYGCPATYGMGVYFGWNPWVGWTFGWGWGFYAGWYGPYSPWWGPWYGPAYPWGWWGGGAAAWNVYGHWGNAAVRGTAAAWANPWTGNYGRAARGGFYNERTGGQGIGRAGINTNVYTGTTRAGAQGIRYNPQTGRVVSGGAVAASNAYTGRAGAAGNRSVVNTNTGRITNERGAAVSGPAGAAGAGAFNSDGARVDAAGAGGFHYNADSGTLNSGGAVKINDNVFAGKDGNVYRYNDGNWQQVTRPDRNGSATLPAQAGNLDRDRIARDRGEQRLQGELARPSPYQRQQQYQRPQSRPVGGYRGNLGARPAGGFHGGGGFRGGGFRGGGFRR